MWVEIVADGGSSVPSESAPIVRAGQALTARKMDPIPIFYPHVIPNGIYPNRRLQPCGYGPDTSWD